MSRDMKAGSGFTPGQQRGAGASEEHSDVRATDKIKQRTCLGCREMKDKGELVRLVAGPDGLIVVDYKGNLPGRGAYVCPKESCIRESFLRKQILRVFEGARTEGVEELLGRLRKRVWERALSLISLSRKAGKVVDGREAIDKGIEKGDIMLLLLAQDLSTGSSKEIIDNCLRREIRYYTYLSKDEMGVLIGKGERGAVGITDESLASLLEKELDRLKGLGSAGGEKNG